MAINQCFAAHLYIYVSLMGMMAVKNCHPQVGSSDHAVTKAKLAYLGFTNQQTFGIQATTHGGIAATLGESR